MGTSDTRFPAYDRVFHFSSTDLPVIQALWLESVDSLAYPGDNFTADLLEDSEPWLVTSPGISEPLGYFAIKDKFHLASMYIRPAYRKYDRQIMEQLLNQFNIHYGFIRSWDHAIMATYLEFIRRSELQAYQFQLLYPELVPKRLPHIRIRLAKAEDLPFLEEMAFLTNHAGYLRRQELWIARDEEDRRVGIGVIQPHKTSGDFMDIGMFTIPTLRQRGIGQTILRELMRLVLDSGRTPVAGCFYKNHASRRTLEAAGMSCIGTIFRFSFDKDRLKLPD